MLEIGQCFYFYNYSISKYNRHVEQAKSEFNIQSFLPTLTYFAHYNTILNFVVTRSYSA